MIVTKRTIEKLKARDEETFELVYNQFENLIYYICFSITLNKEASEDLTQDTFVKLINSLDNYEEKGNFKQYLMEIARNLAKNYVTRVQSKETLLNDEESDFDDFQSSNDDESTNSLILTLQGILDKDEADIVILKIVHDFKFKEIAEYKKMTLGEVQARYYKALEKVKVNYEKGD